jgi:hypothetical protein
MLVYSAKLSLASSKDSSRGQCQEAVLRVLNASIMVGCSKAEYRPDRLAQAASLDGTTLPDGTVHA